MIIPLIFALDPWEKVGCYFCQKNNDFTMYGRDQAYLASAEHRPYDGNANFVCVFHLEERVNVYDGFAKEHYGLENKSESKRVPEWESE